MARNKRAANGDGRGEPRPRMVVEDVPLAEATRSRYLNYALSVITSRALPDVRDGLKPVQRRILYAMWSDLHVTADGRYIKSAAVVGEVMKNYHPHGDQSIYDALVRMAQPFSLRHNLIEGYGNFGSLDGELPLEKLLRRIKGPDFPTGGVILNSADEIRQVYATGQGSIKVRGTYEPDPEKPNTVLVTSIPYGIEKDALVQRIGELIGKGQVPQLTNVKDLSTDDVRISLELRPGANADAALAYLFKNTPLQTNFNVNLTCLLPAEGAEVAVPARLDLKSMLGHFLDFRLEVVTRRLQHELEGLRNRIHILEGFAIVFNNLDEAIRTLRASDG